MESAREILELLKSDDSLWNVETRHEAWQLARTIYIDFPEHRKELIDHILIGPPQFKTDEKSRDYYIFQLLSYFEASRLKLTKRASFWINAAKKKYAFSYSERSDMPGGLGSIKWADATKHFTVEQIENMDVEEISNQILNLPSGPFGKQSDFCELVASIGRKKPDWILKIIRQLSTVTKSIPNETIESLTLGIFPVSPETPTSWNSEQLKELFTLLRQMIAQRYDPSFWQSLGYMCRHIYQETKFPIENWTEFLKDLTHLFRDFDYSTNQKDWFLRAINHPLGNIAELYIKQAGDRVQQQSVDGLPYDLPEQTVDFMEYVTTNYSLGTRHALCEICHYISWLEKIDLAWCKKHLLQFFLWEDSSERSFVAWAGYLAGLRLSEMVTSQSKKTYDRAALHYNEFSKEESNRLSIHFASLIWFDLIELDQLQAFAKNSDVTGREKILNSWHDFLKQAERTKAENFWHSIILPYWSWCEKNSLLLLPEGNGERYSFWRILPYSFRVFPTASQIAVKPEYAPSTILHVHWLLKELLSFPDPEPVAEDLINLLIALLETDAYPYWERDNWLKAKSISKMWNARNWENFVEELEKKNIQEADGPA